MHVNSVNHRLWLVVCVIISLSMPGSDDSQNQKKKKRKICVSRSVNCISVLFYVGGDEIIKWERQFPRNSSECKLTINKQIKNMWVFLPTSKLLRETTPNFCEKITTSTEGIFLKSLLLVLHLRGGRGRKGLKNPAFFEGRLHLPSHKARVKGLVRACAEIRGAFFCPSTKKWRPRRGRKNSLIDMLAFSPERRRKLDRWNKGVIIDYFWGGTKAAQLFAFAEQGICRIEDDEEPNKKRVSC